MLETKDPVMTGESSFSTIIAYILRVVTVLLVGAVLTVILLVKAQPVLSRFANDNICPSNPSLSFCKK